MAEIEISQAEADALIQMEKQRVDDRRWRFPAPGERLAIPLTSLDKRENFVLDITRGRLKLTQASYQNRVRQAIILLRLDIDGPTHRNPDDQEIPCPHLHVYREGYGDKWAESVPAHLYPSTSSLFLMFEAFMGHCNIIVRPEIELGLFS